MNRDHIISAISDHFKSANGFRPRGIWDFEEMTDSELLALEERVYADACSAWEREKARQAESAERFENLVLETVAMGAGTREVALRWLLSTEASCWHPTQLPSMFCFEYDLPSSYEAELKAVLTA